MSVYQLAHKSDAPYEMAERKGHYAADESIPYEVAASEAPVDDVNDKTEKSKKKNARYESHVSPSLEHAEQYHEATAPYSLARHTSAGSDRRASDPVYEMASSKLRFTDEELLVRSGQLVSCEYQHIELLTHIH